MIYTAYYIFTIYITLIIFAITLYILIQHILQSLYTIYMFHCSCICALSLYYIYVTHIAFATYQRYI